MGYFISDLCSGCGACMKLCPVAAISGEKKQRHMISKALCIECGACGRICPESAVLDDKGQVIAKLKKGEWPKPVIDTGFCSACENCVQICPTHALTMVDDKLPLTQNYAVLSHPNKCVSCGWCKDHCLFDAIAMRGVS